MIGPLALACPGRRSIGAVDGDEIALRAVLGQQVSVAAARRLAGQLTTLCGRTLPRTSLVVDDPLTHVFPDAATVAGLDPETLPMPRSRARALVGLAEALASGAVSLDPGADREEAGARLLALPGIGPWTVGYIRMRALSDPDAFPSVTSASCGRCGCSGTTRAPDRGRIRGRGGAALAAVEFVRGPSSVGNARS